MDLDASDEQLDCPFIFASAKGGYRDPQPELMSQK